MKHFRINLAVCSLTLCMSTALQAADFTINVPVNITRMPSTVTTVIVKCAVMCGSSAQGLNTTLVNQQDIWNNMGLVNDNNDIVGVSNEVERSINTSTGTYQGMVSVPVNSSQGRYPNNAGSYVCAFKFRDQNQGEGFTGGPDSVFDIGGGNVNQFVSTGSLISSGTFVNNAMAGTECNTPNVNTFIPNS